MKKKFFLLLPLLSVLFSLIFCEIVLRIKDSVILNYDIEMWKYAKYLKIEVQDKNIGHVHKKNSTRNLQNVNIRINNYGQRDIDYNNEYLKSFDKSFLLIGSSVTLGWGVENNMSYSSVLNKLSKKNNKNWIFVNGGVGNYNTLRYVNNYLKYWKHLKFDHILINYFVNDAEILENQKTNFFVKHTHIGVAFWKFIKSFDKSLKKENIKNYYQKIYDDNYAGFIVARNEIKKLNDFCLTNNIKCILVNIPDINQLNPYQLEFINEKMKIFANNIKIDYIDLLPIFNGIDKKKLLNNYQDPHPNYYAHELIAKEIFDKIK